MEIEQISSRKDVLKFIAQSSIYGNLGLFIGSGFSMAVMNDIDTRPIALNWLGLIEKIAQEFSISCASLRRDGQSLPELVSVLVNCIASQQNKTYMEAMLDFKKKVSSLTAYYPPKHKRDLFGAYLNKISPKWIITTNYDLVIECLLPGKCVPLGPTEQLIAPQGIIPVYHLHGIKTNPSSIVISQEDYVSLFRPNEYRHTKLPLTIKESTTLIIGYGLNDINVLTAVDWSKNVFKSAKTNYPHEIIQVLYRGESYASLPYRNKDGIVIIEVNNLEDFFIELQKVIKKEVRDNDNLKLDL